MSLEALRARLHTTVLGSENAAELLLTALLARGHVLIEGAPGIGKTSLASTLAKSMGGIFKRVQFTPDLLPADVVGTMIYNQAKNEFVVRKGPIFSNFILADEINRAPAKVQSALLEAMQQAAGALQIAPDQLLAHLNDAGLSKYDMPEFFIRMDAFPLTASGKILKRELMAWAKAGMIAPVPVRWNGVNQGGIRWLRR